ISPKRERRLRSLPARGQLPLPYRLGLRRFADPTRGPVPGSLRSPGAPSPGVARSPHPPRLPRRSLRSLRAAGPRGTRGSRTTRSPVPPRVGSGCSSCWSSLGLAHELDSIVSALVAHRLVDVKNRLVLEVVVGTHLVNAERNCLHHGFEFEATCDSAPATG